MKSLKTRPASNCMMCVILGVHLKKVSSQGLLRGEMFLCLGQPLQTLVQLCQCLLLGLQCLLKCSCSVCRRVCDCRPLLDIEWYDREEGGAHMEPQQPHTHIHTHTHMKTHMYTYIHTYKHTHTCMKTHTYTYTNAQLYVCVYMYMHTCTCICTRA